MIDTYEDIIHLPHHVSLHRSHISMEMRAAQFSPFAALTGFEDVIEQTQEQARQQYETHE